MSSPEPLILSLDQGTTSSRAIVFELNGQSLYTAQQEFTQHFPRSGWVEHDPAEIWATTLSTAREALAEADRLGRRVMTIGITNQRETTIVWERATGKPVHNAIVWQDRRTAALCSELKTVGAEQEITDKTGLLLDPYFSGTKIRWILDHHDLHDRAERGELCFGTVDTWLLWNLTGGQTHLTDATNASRTLLYNIHQGAWDEDLLRLLKIPAALLPQVRDCASDFGFSDESVLGARLPIQGIAGDQHAASIGQACFTPGMIKSTYGTGCFMMLNTGSQAIPSRNRLLTTICYQLDGKPTYALEGSIFVAGAAIQWLRDGLGVIQSAGQTEQMAASLNDNNGVYLVPAFTGLGAPWWDPQARGAIYGLTRDAGPAHFARAALESVCYQTNDLFRAMTDDSARIDTVRVDGGMISNAWLMQFLTDILDVPVQCPSQPETTALGAACLAGLQAGLFRSVDDISHHWSLAKTYSPAMQHDTREDLITNWQSAIRRTLSNS